MNRPEKSQNGLEMTTVGHLVQPPCSNKVILDNIAQGCIQMALEYFQSGRLHNLSWHSVLVHGQLQSKDPPNIQVEHPVHQFLPVAFYPIAHHHWEESGSSCL